MDKQKFLQIAPSYYALGICGFFENASIGTYSEIAAYLGYQDENELYVRYLIHRPLFEAAIKWLVKKGMIEALIDDFGPPIYRRSDDFFEIYPGLNDDPDLPFRKYSIIEGKQSWLRSALVSVNQSFDALNIEPSDFDNQSDEWAPIPIERPEPE